MTNPGFDFFTYRQNPKNLEYLAQAIKEWYIPGEPFLDVSSITQPEHPDHVKTVLKAVEHLLSRTWNVREIKTANALSGRKFFSSDTMHAFKSRVQTQVWHVSGNPKQGTLNFVLFVISNHSGLPGKNREYCLAAFEPLTGNVHYFPVFFKRCYSTANEAKRAAIDVTRRNL